MSRRTLLAIVLIVCALCALLFVAHNFHRKPAVQNTSQSLPIQQHGDRDAGLPVRLKIPRIGVDAAVEDVGLTPDGSMGVPDRLADVAWYKLGPRPGQWGSAVIAGHRSSKEWMPAVFDNLHDLHPGDYLYIEDDKGSTIAFIVRESRIYDPEANAGDVFSQSDGVHLNLITCDGTWNEAQKSFSKRLVIFADAL
jgi:LPXTG-site transpeptidase (sortase) family protein